MLDVSNQDSDDETLSMTSEKCVGRGQTILNNFRGTVRGNIRGLRRGLRGRLLH